MSCDRCSFLTQLEVSYRAWYYQLLYFLAACLQIDFQYRNILQQSSAPCVPYPLWTGSPIVTFCVFTSDGRRSLGTLGYWIIIFLFNIITHMISVVIFARRRLTQETWDQSRFPSGNRLITEWRKQELGLRHVTNSVDSMVRCLYSSQFCTVFYSVQNCCYVSFETGKFNWRQLVN